MLQYVRTYLLAALAAHQTVVMVLVVLERHDRVEYGLGALLALGRLLD